MATNCTTLKYLSLFDCRVEKSRGKLTGMSESNGQGSGASRQSVHSVEEFVLAQVWVHLGEFWRCQIGDSTMKAIEDNLPNLRRLGIDFCLSVSSEATISMLHKCSRIEKLDFTH